MKRFTLALAVILAVVVLVLPTVALAVDPVPLWPPEDPAEHLTVPANTPLFIPGGWVGGAKGMVMQAPKYNFFFFTITRHTASGDVGVLNMTEEQSTQYWQPGVIPAEDLWPADEIPPLFKERVHAGVFLKDWIYDIPEGLPAGEYTFVAGGTQTKTLFDLLWYFDGQRAPMKLEGGEFSFPTFDFTVE
jgi:hypothetical protein